MAKIIHKRPFASTPANMGYIIGELIGGGHLPLRHFNKETKKWLEPTDSCETGKPLGMLSLVLDLVDIPQEYWTNALVVDVQMRINELWPDLVLEIRDDPAIGGSYAFLRNRKSLCTVGTGVVQQYKEGCGPSYYDGPNLEPRRSTYDTDVSKLVVRTYRGNGNTLYLVDKEGRRITGEALKANTLKGEVPVEDFAWIVESLGHHPAKHGVMFSDYLKAAALTGHKPRYNEAGEVTL